MRQRGFVHVGGPGGAGKTKFVEAVLEDNGGVILAGRCVCDDSLTRTRETTPKRDPELRRYRGAGASGVAIFNFPRSGGHDAFFYRGSKRPVAVVVANLLDAKDPGRKKALARVRRALRLGAPEKKNEGTD